MAVTVRKFTWHERYYPYGRSRYFRWVQKHMWRVIVNGKLVDTAYNERTARKRARNFGKTFRRLHQELRRHLSQSAVKPPNGSISGPL
jgi:hypothetical protein